MIYRSPPNPSAIWNEDLIRRYDLAGPRYTSYPTAPQFDPGFTLDDWLAAMTRSHDQQAPLSLYFHIPFCDTVCYYCGCNKIITADKTRAIPYLAALNKEIALQSHYLNTPRRVQQLHFGGGTPTYISDDQMADLMGCINRFFPLLTDDSGDYSIEIHPQTVNPQRLSLLRQLGFNRISLGVQDFHPEVQKAVNRFNSETEVAALVHAGRELRFKSINMDLIYGLPLQTTASFSETLAKVVAMRPDRLSLFNYAHMPQLFKVQRQIDARTLPEPQEKLQMLHNSIEQLVAAGYVYIGMDHFALPDDELALAQANGVLHRNFQGYTTHGECDLLAFGVSAINAVDNIFAQNHKDIQQYQQALEQNRLPLSRGITLSLDDAIRRRVINQLICHFELSFSEIEQRFGIVFSDYFSTALLQLKTMEEDGLLRLGNTGITVLPAGRLLIRRICMAFDAYLPPMEAQTDRYSRII